jgi:hypothetical protein
MFGDETVSPIAKVLNGFGQGVKENWGADGVGMSEGMLEEMKKVGIKADDWLANRGALAKAANVAVIRPAAQSFYNYAKWWTHAADRVLPSAIGGVTGAIGAVSERAGDTVDYALQQAMDPAAQSMLEMSGLPGMAPAAALYALTPALRMVERGEVDDTCLLAYFPGAGKSMCAIVGAVKRLQMGLSKKALFCVPKNTLHQWQQFFHDCYPTLSEWLLAGTDRAFDPLNRRRFLLNAALGDAKIVLLTYEQFRSIPLRPETATAYLQREVDELRAALVDGGDDEGDCETDEDALEAGTAATGERRRVNDALAKIQHDHDEFRKSRLKPEPVQ